MAARHDQAQEVALNRQVQAALTGPRHAPPDGDARDPALVAGVRLHGPAPLGR